MERVPITTTVMLIRLNGIVDRELAFRFLPLYLLSQTEFEYFYLDHQFPNAETKDEAETLTEAPRLPDGSITSLRYNEICRGVTGEFFKNSIQLDIWVNNTKLAIKLSKASIHIAGTAHRAEGEAAARFLVAELNRIQNTVIPSIIVEEWMAALFEILCRAEEECPDINAIDQTVRDTVWTKLVAVHTDPAPEMLALVESMFTDYINNFARTILLALPLLDVTSESELCTPDLSIAVIEIPMINHNYALGYNVRLGKLHKLINSLDNGWVSYYRPDENDAVRIHIPYVSNNPEKRKNHYSIIVYRTGSVTQSTNDTAQTDDIYAAMMALCRENENLIRNPWKTTKQKEVKVLRRKKIK